MKLNDTYWIYFIKCNVTGKTYVGQTGKPNPMMRWSDHFVELRNGISRSPLLQKAWNEHPDLTCWTFGILDVVRGKRPANWREAERILEISPGLRLNTNKTSVVTLERRRQTEEMIRAGRKYIDIRDEVGVSLGTISKIRHRMDLPNS